MQRAALVIALLALVGAWVGPAVADGLLTGGDVRNGSLTGRDVRDRSLTGRDVRDRSLTGRDVRSNSLTGRVISGLSGRDILPDSIDGSDVAEETLDVRRARTAGHADTAAALSSGGLAPVHAALAPGASAVALELAGLTLSAACSGSSALTLTATTATGPAFIRTGGQFRTPNSQAQTMFAKDDDLRPGDEFDALGGVADNLSAQLVYSPPEGGAVTVAFLAEGGLPAAAGGGCLVAGTATHTAR